MTHDTAHPEPVCFKPAEGREVSLVEAGLNQPGIADRHVDALLNPIGHRRRSPLRTWRCPPVILTVDHIRPFSKGGTERESNLWLLCGSCNSTKLDGTRADLFRRLRAKGVATAQKPRQPAARQQRARKAPDLVGELCTFFGPATHDPFFGNPPKANAPRKPRQAAAAGAPKLSKPKARPRKPSWEDLWDL